MMICLSICDVSQLSSGPVRVDPPHQKCTSRIGLGQGVLSDKESGPVLVPEQPCQQCKNAPCFEPP